MTLPLLEAVVLAAGLSSRAGAFKPALDCGGMPMVVRTVRAFTGVCRRIWVVTGHRADEVAALVSCEPLVRVVHNPCWERGMFSSVQAGVSRVTSGRFFVSPGDLPGLGHQVTTALAGAAGSVVAPAWEGVAGHPVLLDGSWIPVLLSADPGANLRDLLSGTERTLVPAGDEGVVRDIDTCEDYEDYLRRTQWAMR